MSFATFGVIFAFICQYSASIASQGFGTDVRNAMFKKIGTLSFAQLDKFGTPSLINRITGDVTQLQSAVTNAYTSCNPCAVSAASADLLWRL